MQHQHQTHEQRVQPVVPTASINSRRTFSCSADYQMSNLNLAALSLSDQPAAAAPPPIRNNSVSSASSGSGWGNKLTRCAYDSLVDLDSARRDSLEQTPVTSVPALPRQVQQRPQQIQHHQGFLPTLTQPQHQLPDWDFSLVNVVEDDDMDCGISW